MSEEAVIVRRDGAVGTVVLNRPEKVAAETVARVQASIDRLGFVRNDAARQLRAGRSRTIGLVVLDIRNPIHHTAMIYALALLGIRSASVGSASRPCSSGGGGGASAAGPAAGIVSGDGASMVHCHAR